jgi:hypothetical protein
MFFYEHDVKCSTAWRNTSHISVGSSRRICVSSSLTHGLVVAVRRIGHRSHRISVRYIAMYGVAWKLWCMHARWTREKNYFGEFSMLQDAQITSQCFVWLHILWLHGLKNVYRQVKDTLKTCINSELRICNCTIKTILKNVLLTFSLIQFAVNTHSTVIVASRTHVYLIFLTRHYRLNLIEKYWPQVLGHP